MAQPVDGIQAYKDSVSKITSYDVFVLEETSFHLKAVPVEPMKDSRGRRQPRVTLRKYLKGEEQDSRQGVTRQVWESTGRRRIEVSPDAGHYNSASVFDGEVVKEIETKGLQGSVRAELPDHEPLLLSENRYDVLYSELFYGGTYAELLSDRSKVEVEHNNERTVVHSPAQSGNMYPDYSFTLVLDKLHGNLPNLITVYRDEDIKSESTISRFKEIGDGVWVPVEAEHRFYAKNGSIDGGEPMLFSTTSLSIDEDRSVWNRPISEDLFTLTFPAGSRIHDKVRGMVFVSRGNESRDELNSLYEKGRDVVRLDQEGRVLAGGQGVRKSEPPFRSQFWAVVALALTMVAAVVVMMRRRVSHRT